MRTYPFHLAFFVRDLVSTREFYGNILGCAEGMSAETWIDFDFFGNQLSAHLADQIPSTRNTGLVDGIAVPMPYFGCILPWGEFKELVDRLRAAYIEFIIEPRMRFEGEPGEQALMFLRDFSGNALEFKSFRHPEYTFTGHEGPPAGRRDA